MRRISVRVGSGLALGFACAAATAFALAACSGSGDERDDTMASAGSGKTRILVDEPFRCIGRVELDLVRVTMRKAAEDAIVLDENCTGRIERIEVETWTADGISIRNHGKVAHDLLIESGYVKCHAFATGAHQDGIQAMGGRSLTFRDLRIDCLGNANFFVAEGGSHASTPTDIVCEGCVLGPHSAHTVFYGASVRSGTRRTTICTGRFRAVRVEPDAEAIVDDANTVLPADDPACADVTGRGEAD